MGQAFSRPRGVLSAVGLCLAGSLASQNEPTLKSISTHARVIVVARGNDAGKAIAVRIDPSLVSDGS